MALVARWQQQRVVLESMTSMERNFVIELVQATEEKMVQLPKEIAEEYAKADYVMELSDQKAKEERDKKKSAAMVDASSTLAIGNAHGKRKAAQQSRGKRNRK